jgi:hypothetical protein
MISKNLVTGDKRSRAADKTHSFRISNEGEARAAFNYSVDWDAVSRAIT